LVTPHSRQTNSPFSFREYFVVIVLYGWYGGGPSSFWYPSDYGYGDYGYEF
jgi:hypothetical protein